MGLQMPADHGELDTAKIVQWRRLRSGWRLSWALPADTTLNGPRRQRGGRIWAAGRCCALWSRRSCGSDGANMVLMEPVADASVAVTGRPQAFRDAAVGSHVVARFGRHRAPARQRATRELGRHSTVRGSPPPSLPRCSFVPQHSTTAQRVVRRLLVGKIFFRVGNGFVRVHSSRRYTTATCRSRQGMPVALWNSIPLRIVRV